MRYLMAALVFLAASAIHLYSEAVASDNTGTPVTKETFLQKMQKREPYWTMERSYVDRTVSKQNKVCISTIRSPKEEDKGKDIFLQKYKLEGCDWFTSTHDARYNVTFESTPSVGAGLSITLTPIDSDILEAKKYSVEFWHPEGGCFVLKFQDSKGTNQCELLAWKEKARKEEHFPECLAAYKSACRDPEEYKLYTEYCEINNSKMMEILGKNQDLLKKCMKTL